MISRETQVVTVFGLAAIILRYVVATATDLPTWVAIALVLSIGVLIPQGIVTSMHR